MKSIAIMGASGHCKVVADIARLNGYDEIVFVDKNPECDKFGEYHVADEDTDLDYYLDNNYDFIVGIGDGKIRRKVQENLEALGADIVSLVHPKAVVAHDTTIGQGTVVMAGAVINPGTTIGKGCIINTSASVDHDNVVGDYVHISVGAHTAGTVKVGDNCWCGIGSIISNNIDVCEDVFLCAGTVVVKNIEKPGKYAGVPARFVPF